MAERTPRDIFLVDDDDIMRQVLRMALREGGHRVVGEAGHAQRAHEAIRLHPPALVFLDIVLPGVSGLSLLETLHADYPELRLIMISSEATRDRVREALDKGAAGFVVKPFTVEAVLNAVERAFAPRA